MTKKALRETLRSRDKDCLSALRFISAAPNQRRIHERILLENRCFIEIMNKLAKRQVQHRTDSAKVSELVKAALAR